MEKLNKHFRSPNGVDTVDNSQEMQEELENIKSRVFSEAEFHRKSYSQKDNLKRGSHFTIKDLENSPIFKKILTEVTPYYLKKGYDRYNQGIGLLADMGLELYELDFDSIKNISENDSEYLNERMRIILNKISDHLSYVSSWKDKETIDHLTNSRIITPYKFKITDSLLKDNFGCNILTFEEYFGQGQYAVVADNESNFGMVRLSADEPEPKIQKINRPSSEEAQKIIYQIWANREEEKERKEKEKEWYQEIKGVVDFHRIDEKTASITVSFKDGTTKESVVQLDKRLTPEMEEQSFNRKIEFMKKMIDNIDNSGQ